MTEKAYKMCKPVQAEQMEEENCRGIVICDTATRKAVAHFACALVFW